MVGEAAFHRRRDPQARVNANEVIVGEVERIRGLVIHPLLREGVCQPGHSPHRHSDREILPLDMGRADACRIGIAKDRRLDAIDDLSRRVALLAFATRGVDFDDLPEVHILTTQAVDHCIPIRDESIRADLKTSRRGMGELFREDDRVFSRSLSQVPREN